MEAVSRWACSNTAIIRQTRYAVQRKKKNPRQTSQQRGDTSFRIRTMEEGDNTSCTATVRHHSYLPQHDLFSTKCRTPKDKTEEKVVENIINELSDTYVEMTLVRTHCKTARCEFVLLNIHFVQDIYRGKTLLSYKC